MYKKVVTEEVSDILSRSKITETLVVLPPEQLDRKVYKAVNAVLEALGGKWDRGLKAHHFTNDPREALKEAMRNGEVQDKRKAQNQFFTPPDIAEKLCDLAGVTEGMRVLEPSAGDGAIARIVKTRGATVHCVEIDPVLADNLMNIYDTVICADFLGIDGDLKESYDAVVMNPPFARGQDFKHVMHAMKFLKPGGKLAAVVSLGRAFSNPVQCLPAGTFKGSGTNVGAKIIVLEKTEKKRKKR